MTTFKIRFSLFAGILVGIGSLFAAAETTPIQQMSLSDLEERLTEIEAELETLAYFSLNTGVGAIGYRSDGYEQPDQDERVQIDLEETCLIDQIVLVPTVWRDLNEGFVADAFPAAFRVLVGSDEDTEGHVVAEYDFADAKVDGIAPVILSINPVEASWVRIETSRLSRRARDGKYLLQLAEVMVFQGAYNQALRKPVTTSVSRYFSNAWKPAWLVDGILPYVMNSAEGEKSLPMISRVNIGESATISIDLEQSYPVSRLRLHAVDQGDTRPRAFSGDFGIPQAFILEGANQPDFSDAAVLLNVNFDGVFNTGPIMEWAFSAMDCRYVRLVATRPYLYKSERSEGTRIGFAEMELLTSEGNVSLGKSVTPDFRLSSELVTRGALTDGHNLNGKILPIRDWMEQLARRRELEAARPIVVTELSLRYAQQKTNLKRLVWLVGLLVAIIAVTQLYFRLSRQRQESAIRERIAANLHDELGANLHAIGLLGDLAKDAVENREDLIDTVDRMRALTVRTGKAARDCSNLLEAQGFCEDLVFEIKQDGDRLLGDLEHRLEVEGEAFINQLGRRTRLDLYLFYKETLTNIIRHSAATMVKSQLIADEKYIRLIVMDNGHGLKESVPKSLVRRARMLRGDLSLEKPESGTGTRIKLVVKKRRFGLL